MKMPVILKQRILLYENFYVGSDNGDVFEGGKSCIYCIFITFIKKNGA